MQTHWHAFDIWGSIGNFWVCQEVACHCKANLVPHFVSCDRTLLPYKFMSLNLLSPFLLGALSKALRLQAKLHGVERPSELTNGVIIIFPHSALMVTIFFASLLYQLQRRCTLVLCLWYECTRRPDGVCTKGMEYGPQRGCLGRAIWGRHQSVAVPRGPHVSMRRYAEICEDTVLVTT